MFKLTHISDVHLSPLPDPTWRELMSKRITGYINWKRNRKSSLGNDTLEKIVVHMKSQTPDHIAVTGDLTNLSLPKEFENAAAFLQSLGEPENVSAICGNHDAYVPGALDMAIEAWQPWLSGDDQPTTSEDDFPYVRVRGDVAIIGCNSAEATGPFLATGTFGREQGIRLAHILYETKHLCRVVMIHHPPFHDATPDYKRLIGIDFFHNIVKENGADLIIHGHTHLDTNILRAFGVSDIPIICVSAAGQGIGGHKPPAQYNLFNIDKNGDGWQIELQRYGLDETGDAVIRLSSEILRNQRY